MQHAMLYYTAVAQAELNLARKPQYDSTRTIVPDSTAVHMLVLKSSYGRIQLPGYAKLTAVVVSTKYLKY